MDCLESLIGLAAGPVSCFPFPADADKQAITTSATGLFLADVEGLPIRPANSTQTGPRDFYDRLAQARRTGAATLRADLTKGLAGRFLPKPAWSGPLGSPNFQETGNGPATLRLYTQNRPGQVLKLTSIAVQTTASTEVVTVALNGNPISQIITLNQGGQTLAEPVVIPLDGKTHVLTAELPDGVRPRISKVCCYGCGGCGVLNELLRAEDEGKRVDWLSYGFSVQAAVECLPEALDMLCYVTQDAHAEIRTILAQAVWYAAAQKYCISLLTDTAEGSRYTAFTPEALKNQIAMYGKEVDKHVTWLVSRQAIAGVNNPCYLCQGGGGLSIKKTY